MTTTDVKKDDRAPARRRRGGGGTATGASARSRILVTAILAVAAVYFLVPVYWVFVAATKTTSDLFDSFGFGLGEEFVLFANVSEVLTYNGGVFWRWTLNSLLYSVLGALLATLLAAAAGYALAKYDFRGRELVFGLVLGGVLVPAAATALPLYLLFSQIGLANTYWAVLLPGLISPFGLYLCRIYADASVPDSVIESARLEGAGEGRIFFTLGLRMMAPALVTVFLFQMVGIWNNYFLPLVMLADEELYPITLGLVTWQSYQGRDIEMYTRVVTGSMLSVIPLIIAIIVLQRYWRGGMTAGAVKG
ncbi:multiple sugar transport system permease protein [Nocardiopsis arvandica]|uniref:Multiple sugar transport system permease protein n=1 Tax=Nocardiopsis sinuspersici TaxID=501010 RepID=A0A7Z0BKD4_9ACTN|nr:carbohydrate ABC transporter permease [Nocardiopsis sinuspersici]NYH53055.1 multiple sugar transport system permease protein [Nocardiopsis sinuspersici]